MYGYRFRPGAGTDGELVGGDQRRDIALVSFESTEKDIVIAELGNSDAVEVGIVVVHEPVIITDGFEAGGVIGQEPGAAEGAGGGDPKDSVGADAALPIAQGGDELWGEGELGFGIGQDDEVVLSAVAFGEGDGGWVGVGCVRCSHRHDSF